MAANKGHENLIPQNKRTKEQQRKIAKMGGIASGKARQERKTLKEELLLLLSKGDTQEKISLALLQEAMNGNTKAFEVLRDTVGEKPVDKQEVKQEITSINIKLEDDPEEIKEDDNE